jgi:dephospho-CoA kinase
MKLIGITGKARSGKDTIARHLWAQHAFTRIAFADPLKLAAQSIFGLTHDQTWNDDLKKW